jgi:hypothetical protein
MQTSDLEPPHLNYQSHATLSERLLRDDQAKQLRELLTSAAMPEAMCDSSDLRVLLRKSKDGGAVLGVQCQCASGDNWKGRGHRRVYFCTGSGREV